MNTPAECPCQSGILYMMCCEPFHLGVSTCETPEQLMRSRYVAFYTLNFDYIQRTMTGPALAGFNLESTMNWAQNVQWMGLKVLSTKVDGSTGFVSFEAAYVDNGEVCLLKENSRFIRQNGAWMYIDGVQVDDFL